MDGRTGGRRRLPPVALAHLARHRAQGEDSKRKGRSKRKGARMASEMRRNEEGKHFRSDTLTSDSLSLSNVSLFPSCPLKESCLTRTKHSSAACSHTSKETKRERRGALTDVRVMMDESGAHRDGRKRLASAHKRALHANER